MMYKVGTILNCNGLLGVVVFPKNKDMITVSWKGLDELETYSKEWIKENCTVKTWV
jgi:hypothetical protein